MSGAGLLGAASLALVCALAGAAGAVAQPVERNPPPATPTPPSEALPVPRAPPLSGDDRPLSPAIKALVLLGPTDAAPTAASAASVDVSRLGPTAAGLAAELSPFLGRPMSRRNISRIETLIVEEYRRRGRPFVQVSLPEQEVSQGLLSLRVIEFHLGEIKVKGAQGAAASRLGRAVRRQPDGAIDAGRLSQDLDWLNRDPFRSVTAGFAPGANLGATDLTLTATRSRPWQVFAGYANSGTPETSEHRYFMGASAEVLPALGAVMSLQMTGSPDFWGAGGRPFGQPHPQYRSLSGSLDLPLAPRQALDLSIDAVESNIRDRTDPFASRQQTVEVSLVYRAALSNLLPLPGDVALGVEVKRQTRSTLFGGDPVYGVAAGIYQLMAGWSGTEQDRVGRSAFDLTVHVSPSRFNASNSDQALAAFSQGEVTSTAYTYADLNVSRATYLSRSLTLVSQISAQYAGRAIPNSEQMALGGVSAVRGYSLDDGAYDDAVVLRDELRLTGAPWLQRGLLTVDRPFLFADLGHARDEAAKQDLTIGSLGLGADWRIGRANASLALSDPLTDGPATRAGHWRADFKVAVSY